MHKPVNPLAVGSAVCKGDFCQNDLEEKMLLVAQGLQFRVSVNLVCFFQVRTHVDILFTNTFIHFDAFLPYSLSKCMYWFVILTRSRCCTSVAAKSVVQRYDASADIDAQSLNELRYSEMHCTSSVLVHVNFVLMHSKLA